MPDIPHAPLPGNESRHKPPCPHHPDLIVRLGADFANSIPAMNKTCCPRYLFQRLHVWGHEGWATRMKTQLTGRKASQFAWPLRPDPGKHAHAPTATDAAKTPMCADYTEANKSPHTFRAYLEGKVGGCGALLAIRWAAVQLCGWKASVGRPALCLLWIVSSCFLRFKSTC